MPFPAPYSGFCTQLASRMFWSSQVDLLVDVLDIQLWFTDSRNVVHPSLMPFRFPRYSATSWLTWVTLPRLSPHYLGLLGRQGGDLPSRVLESSSPRVLESSSPRVLESSTCAWGRLCCEPLAAELCHHLATLAACCLGALCPSFWRLPGGARNVPHGSRMLLQRRGLLPLHELSFMVRRYLLAGATSFCKSAMYSRAFGLSWLRFLDELDLPWLITSQMELSVGLDIGLLHVTFATWSFAVRGTIGTSSTASFKSRVKTRALLAGTRTSGPQS